MSTQDSKDSTQNETCFEVVIMCSGRNVNKYKDYVADLVRKYGDATFKVMPVCKGVVQDHNQKKKKHFKRMGKWLLHVCRWCQ